MTERKLSLPESDALALAHAALNISKARENNNKSELTVALDQNMQIWTTIQVLANKEEHPLPKSVKENLLKLANFVVSRTIAEGCDLPEKTLDAFENINLQIAEGLLENLPSVN